MPKQRPLSSWLFEQAVKMFELARRCEQTEIADEVRKMAHDLLARAHEQAQLQDDREQDRGDDEESMR